MKKLFTQLMVISALIFTALPASAFLELNETAELIPDENTYRIGFFPQLYLENGGGTNFGAFLDMYVGPEFNSRFTLGGGTTDFWASGSLKWVPYPDYGEQPALGFRGGVTYALDNSTSTYATQVTPILSKIFDTKFGKLNPYMGIPVSWVYVNSSRSYTALQFIVGAEWIRDADFQMGGELEMNMQNTTSAISVYLNFPFDERTGFKK
jgi:hypothetical protein